ncbi:hypothetical protein FSB75_09905 [Flavisolibacter ginsenosidimutans]|uniref:Two component regulator three Y domain-containing protein n=1 Tax=Flavisolibacter ginsenosidimutans TaxID=661481 RepID=A0A5B8UJ62_9BACT|nr:hypothetical protein FSB75_09905 [Flavisolibacter ginsenosidimutans]
MNCAGGDTETIIFERPKIYFLYRVCFFLLLLCVGLKGSAQSASSFVFTHYSTKDGLAANELYKVQQDREGFLWIATSNGLQRFDGVRFRTFRHEEGNANSLPSNVIQRLFIDKNDVLWGATGKAEFFQFDKSRFTYRQIPVRAAHPEKMLSNETMFVPDENGHLFLLTLGSELLAYDEKKNEFSQEANFIPLPKTWGVTALVQQPGTQKYWLGLQSGGIAIYNRQTGNLSYYGHNVEHEPAIELWGTQMIFFHPLFDKKNHLWAVTWGPGIPLYVQYNLQRPTEPLKISNFWGRIPTYHELNGFVEQSDGRIWIKGLNALAYFDEQVNDFVVVKPSGSDESGIKYEGLSALFEDRDKNLWAGTNNNGLYRFNPSTQIFTNVLHPRRFVKAQTGTGAVMSFIQLKNGSVLSGTWEDAMFQYTKDLKPLPLPAKMPFLLANAYAWSMCASGDSNSIWMGAQPGFWQYNQQAQTARFYDPPVMEKRTVRQIAEDKTGTLWLGTHNFGLFRCVQPKREGKDSVVRVGEVGTSLINKLMADSKGLVWVGTSDKGLYVYDAASARLLHHYYVGINGNDAAPGCSVTCLLEYNDSLVFVADDSRLYSYNRNTATLRVRRITGSVAGTISAMEKDDDGFIWISTTGALYRIHPTNKTAMVFNRQDGILNDQFVLGSSYRLRDGRLLFGTNNSFVAFDPKVAGAMAAAPSIRITSLQVGPQELPVDSVLQLKQLLLTAKNNALAVEFSSLQYNALYPIQYKMENIDNDWRFADADNKVTYPYLPPGHYRLLLRAYKPDGQPAGVTELRIQVKPPWYQTWWFYTLVALAFVIELWWLDRQRSKRKESMQKVRTDIAANLHEEVNTALNNINILSEIARLKSDREPQKAKEYLEQIHTKSHNMIIALDDMLWSLDPENDSMKKTVSRIREFADALMQRHGTLIELLIDKKVEKLELNMKLRHEAFLLFKEGLRSLVEAGTPHCIVHLTAERNKLFFSIEFANEGCDMQQLNNLLQRHDMEVRIQALRAKLDVQLHKSRSMFLLQLPLG